MANVFIEASTMTAIGDAIRAKTGGLAQIYPEDMPAQIASITTGGSGDGSDLVRYVTFLDEDGTHLFKMPVLVGDTCKDPVDHGDIVAPEKEDTNTIDYTYSGWTSESGGTADTDILKNITADKTVYAAFAANTRYYTVTFYDGETLLKTMKVEYGESAEYTPTKAGYVFNEWIPSNTGITEDTICYAQWTQLVDIENATWEDIATLSASGNAANLIEIGATKQVTLSDGNVIEVMVAGFDHDALADGTGTAGITFVVPDLYSFIKSSYSSSNTALYTASTLCSYLQNTVYGMLPDELKSVIKTVNKKCHVDANCTVGDKPLTLFALSQPEIGTPANANRTEGLGTKYAVFNSVKGYYHGTSTADEYWIRGAIGSFGTNKIGASYFNKSGYLYNANDTSTTTGKGKSRCVRFGFCI